MKQSNIFTKAELQEIDKRKKGDKLDKTGIFSGRVRPKITEMLDKWFPEKSQLKKLIKRGGDKNSS